VLLLIGVVELELLLHLRRHLTWVHLILRLSSHLVSVDGWLLLHHAWRRLLKPTQFLNYVVFLQLPAHLEVHDVLVQLVQVVAQLRVELVCLV